MCHKSDTAQYKVITEVVDNIDTTDEEDDNNDERAKEEYAKGEE